MQEEPGLYKYNADKISFRSFNARGLRTIYAPLCSPTAKGIKSSITPYLSGDIKTDKFHYLTKPASTEDLRNHLRDFYLDVKDKGVVSFTTLCPQADQSEVEIGQMWHKLTCTFSKIGLKMTALNFVPVSGEDIEIMQISCTNTGGKDMEVTPTSSLPIFGRSLANKHDHEHVTSLLHRITQLEQGVVVEPTMCFNEEGHKPNDAVYFVYGVDDKGVSPVGSFPTFETFYGDQGTQEIPRAIYQSKEPVKLEEKKLAGKEACGALRFEKCILKPDETKTFVVVIGTAESVDASLEVFKKFKDVKNIESALKDNESFWKNKSFSIAFETADDAYNSWMQWVTLQPVLRRIYGCSFLPDHDYGKGGRGWRDIWQDLLSLILIEPETIRDQLINNFAGIRIDGSNATIIGEKPGEFVADRNAITRVWMDHGVWPFLTLLLYVHQTGDFDILLKEQNYFCDPQLSRTFLKDTKWSPKDGHFLKAQDGSVYSATILEHLILQNLVQFYNVGEHNHIRLESADWNDGLDMAFDRGESVTFSAIYGGNLIALAELLEKLSKTKTIETIKLAKEMRVLLDTLTDEPCDYQSIRSKKDRLFDQYFPSVQPTISGDTLELKIGDVAADLRKKGQWIFEHIRKTETLKVESCSKEFTFFNGYYDNTGTRVEGKQDDGKIRMTLTGQVFPILSGLANKNECAAVIESIERFLKDAELGGFRLNTDFGLKHYLDLGRAFGFAYGTKENGAFFSHMTVMYAYGLYKQGFARKGYEVLQSIYKMSRDTDRSKIYPGIPEYFDSDGRGMYHYLTGSASWLVLTQLTQAFGVRGYWGNLMLDPKLTKEEFNEAQEASIGCQFAGKTLKVTYCNTAQRDAGEYSVDKIELNGDPVEFELMAENQVVIDRKLFENKEKSLDLRVVLK